MYTSLLEKARQRRLIALNALKGNVVRIDGSARRTLARPDNVAFTSSRTAPKLQLVAA